MKKFIKALTVTAVFLSLCILNVYADGIKVIIDNKEINFDTEPVMRNDRVMVPLRQTFEALGAAVTWDENTLCAAAEKDGITVSVQSGSDCLTVNQKTVKMDCPVIEISDRILISVRYAAEAFGYTVNWNEDTNSAVISTAPDYECYENGGEKVPVYTSVVTDAKYIEEQLDICTDSDYAYSTTYEDVTEYIMALQKYYGYSYYTTVFGENGDVKYVYRNAETGGTVRILCTNTDKYGYTAVITPTANKQDSPQAQKPYGSNPKKPDEKPEYKQPDENTDVEYYENTDNTLPTYTYVTGVKPYSTEKTEDCTVYKYKDSFASAAQYEMAITMFCGFSEYNTEIDFGSVTTYYTNGNTAVGVVNSMFNNEVWIVVANK